MLWDRPQGGSPTVATYPVRVVDGQALVLPDVGSSTPLRRILMLACRPTAFEIHLSERESRQAAYEADHQNGAAENDSGTEMRAHGELSIARNLLQ